MANRIALGRRKSGSVDRGLMISGMEASPTGSGTSGSPYSRADVTSTVTVNSQEYGNAPHNFDSQAHVGGGHHVFYYTQGIINKPASTLGTRTVDITHNWGNLTESGSSERPLFAARWSYPNDISNGIATECYNPGQYDAYDYAVVYFSGEPFLRETEIREGFKAQHIDSNTIRLTNYCGGHLFTDERISSSSSDHAGHDMYYALIVFYELDYNGGVSI